METDIAALTLLSTSTWTSISTCGLDTIFTSTVHRLLATITGLIVAIVAGLALHSVVSDALRGRCSGHLRSSIWTVADVGFTGTIGHVKTIVAGSTECLIMHVTCVPFCSRAIFTGTDVLVTLLVGLFVE
jgi:hypothetical protein